MGSDSRERRQEQMGGVGPGLEAAASTFKAPLSRAATSGLGGGVLMLGSHGNTAAVPRASQTAVAMERVQMPALMRTGCGR